MKIVNNYPDDFKIKVVRHYLETDDGFAHTAEKFDLPSSTIVRNWVDRFRAELVSPAKIRSTRFRPSYTDDFKREVVRHYIETDDSIDQTGKKFNLTSRVSIRKWIDQFQHEFIQTPLVKNAKYQPGYSEEFKIEVVRHYLESDDGFAKTAKIFNLPSLMTIRKWVDNFRGDLLISSMNAPDSDNKPVLPNDPEAMALRIKELEEALRNEQLKNVAINTMIDVAERDLKISIRKKSGAKRSKK